MFEIACAWCLYQGLSNCTTYSRFLTGDTVLLNSIIKDDNFSLGAQVTAKTLAWGYANFWPPPIVQNIFKKQPEIEKSDIIKAEQFSGRYRLAGSHKQFF